MQISEIKISGLRHLPPGETVIDLEKRTVFTGKSDTIIMRILTLLICNQEISPNDFCDDTDISPPTLQITAKLIFPETSQTATTVADSPLPALFHLLQADRQGNLFCLLELCAVNNGGKISLRRNWLTADGFRQHADLDGILHLQILPEPADSLRGNTIYFWKSANEDTELPFASDLTDLPSQLIAFVTEQQELLRQIPLSELRIYSTDPILQFKMISDDLAADGYIRQLLYEFPDFFTARIILLCDFSDVEKVLTDTARSLGISIPEQTLFLPIELYQIGKLWKLCAQLGKQHLTAADLRHQQPNGDFECIAAILQQSLIAGYTLPQSTKHRVITPETIAGFAPDPIREKLWMIWLGTALELFFILPETLDKQLYTDFVADYQQMFKYPFQLPAISAVASADDLRVTVRIILARLLQLDGKLL